MSDDYYSEFVREAFIKPIRSVLIIDDDYPTFDEMLDERPVDGTGPTTKEWRSDPSRIRAVIAQFRKPDHPLLVDIHDGTNVPEGTERNIAAHLHQSDLLVVDYQLDKGKAGDGSMAIEIIRSLMENNHFNLVVVHTKEDLHLVFRDTLIGLLPRGCNPGTQTMRRPVRFWTSAKTLRRAATIGFGKASVRRATFTRAKIPKFASVR